MIVPVIMAGGSGSRLWPVSRASYPKQFLSLNTEATLLQETVNRLAGLPLGESITICNEDHRFFVAEQLWEIGSLGKIILEPFARNTAPAIALAAMLSDPDEVLLVLPADHVIKNEKAFREAVLLAVPLAHAGSMATFGVSPESPHQGYGYIEAGNPRGGGFDVVSFTEKPDEETAKHYLNTGNYYWNSGVFLFKASSYLNELRTYCPTIYAACKEAVKVIGHDMDFIRVDETAFGRCPSESIDYAVMEHTRHAVVVPLEAGWNDIGSWSSAWEVGEKDEFGNLSYGDVVLLNTSNSYVRGEGSLVATIGVQDCVVVATKDSVLVAGKNYSQDVKSLVKRLQEESRPESDHHKKVIRPWGKYEAIDNGDQYQVKRLTVKPGAKLSVQRHRHRAEHWVVVAGLAKVTNGNNTFLLHENESTFIPKGAVHSLENPGTLPLEVIEVQSGDYFGEDDIERFEDRYGRAK